MFHMLRNRSIRLTGIAVCWLACAIPLAAQKAPMGRDEVPLLAEDRPADLDEHNLGPWDRRWVLQSTVVDGEERVLYFCSDFVNGVCRGRELETEPGPLASTRREDGDCSGDCKGEAEMRMSDHSRSCQTDENCPMDDTHLICDAARGRSLRFATAGCQEQGGERCACFAQPKVTSFKSRCKSGTLHNYCRYKCSASSEGTCQR